MGGRPPPLPAVATALSNASSGGDGGRRLIMSVNLFKIQPSRRSKFKRNILRTYLKRKNRAKNKIRIRSIFVV